MKKKQVPNTQRNAIAEAFKKALAATPKRIAPAPAPAKLESDVEAAQQFKLGKGDMV